jgi:ADP-heptose:LPS heptosyltransferase
LTQILLGQLGSNGDCLYATIVARQIKTDFPDCHLTWAVGSFARPVLENNPFVDRIWQIEVRNWSEMDAAWSPASRRDI